MRIKTERNKNFAHRKKMSHEKTPHHAARTFGALLTPHKHRSFKEFFSGGGWEVKKGFFDQCTEAR